MPVLKNPRHEKFAQALFKGKTADDAYAEAGFKPDRGNASRLQHKDNIVQRVAEYLEWEQTVDREATEKAIDKLAITKERVLAELAAGRSLLRMERLLLIVRLIGLIIGSPLKQMTEKEQAEIGKMNAKTAKTPADTGTPKRSWQRPNGHLASTSLRSCGTRIWPITCRRQSPATHR